ncbi:MAG TPA: SAF domain-containing protein [Propionibacteriaceae bacterium]|jgi:pilus assembly protein CpaB|nr:SAF domain-containing protein [Propionibacteriaceae bacterium]
MPERRERAHRVGFEPVKRHPQHRFLRDLRRAASWHRRKLAIVAAIAAVLSAVAAAAPPAPPTSRVVRATTDLTSGAIVRSSDITVSSIAEDALPRGALVDPTAVVGRRLIGPVADGQVLTALDLLGTSWGIGPGHVIAPLRLADSEVAALLQPGALIDVIAADPEGGQANVVATRVRVLTVPASPASEGVSAADGALVLVDVDAETATLLAEAAASTRISVVLR